VDAGTVDGASQGRRQMGALGQSRAMAARAGRSGALRVTPAAASAGRRGWEELYVTPQVVGGVAGAQGA
jgi:hypothetical protein